MKKNIKKFIILPTMVFTIAVLPNCKSSNSNIDNLDADIIPLKDDTTHASSADYCLLTFNSNGGTWKGISGTPKFQVRKGHNWARIKNKKGIPTKDNLTPPTNKVYNGWVDSDNKHLSDYYTFNADSVTLNAKWSDAYNPSAFSTDSWDVFIQAADKGYSELASKYKTAYEYDGYNTFVIQNIGDEIEVNLKTRYVDINGYKNPLREDGKWPVRVIGENHDHIYNGFDKVATLTFEFTYALYPSISYDYTTSMGHQSWDKSSLKEYLNTYLYYQFEDALKNGIQYVDKNTDNGYGVGEVESSKDILFIPSISETSSNLTDYSSYENSIYSFYDVHKSASEIIKRNPFKLDSDGKPIAISTWMRSPNLGRGKNRCAAYATEIPSSSEEELRFGLHKSIDTIGVCPCFAVGEDSRVVYNFTGTGLNITPVDKFADTTHGFRGKIYVTDESNYDIPTANNINIKFTDAAGTTKIIEDSQYKYNDSTGELDISTEAITTDTGKLEISAVPNSNLFKTDSWETLIATAEKGIYQDGGMYDRYGYENYVGRYKYININGNAYRCRVIGQGHDALVDQIGNALLTFQFETVLGDNTLAFSNTDATNFTTSNLNRYLQNQVQFFPSGIKKVKKTVDLKEEGQGFGATTYETKIFPLSFSEMNLEASHPTDNEGKAYTYYENEEYAPDRLKYLNNDKHEEVSHWLRSPATTKKADFVNIDGYIEQDLECTNSQTNYVAPAFCIGVDINGHSVELHGENYTVEGWKPRSGQRYKFTSGGQLVVEGFRADDNYKMTEDSMKVKTSDNEEFKDFTFKYDEVSKTWAVSIMNAPDSDLIVTVAPEGCFKISLLEDNDGKTGSIDVGFDKRESAADVKFDYSTDGENFEKYTFNNYITLNGDTGGNTCVYFRATKINEMLNTDDNKGYIRFITANASSDKTPELALSGNIMSLFDSALDTELAYEFKKPYGVMCMFESCQYIIDASSLILGATTHSDDIEEGEISELYAGLFVECENLRYAPFEINFEFKNDQYLTFASMFAKCSNLEVAPTFRVNRLCAGIFYTTFMECKNLKYASDTIITDGENSNAYMAYASMYNSCTNLIKGPSYIGKENIKTAEGCCYMTFTDCSNLVQASAFNFGESTEDETRIETHCYGMYAGCEAMRTATINTKTLTNWGAEHFKEMFYGCNSLTSLYLTNLDVDDEGYIWDYSCFEDWLLDVTSNGYIYLRNNLAHVFNKCDRGDDTVPNSWGIRNIDTGEEMH